MPILSCILLSAIGNKLQLTTTNLEIYMRHSLSSEIEKDGQIAIPTKLLSDFVEKLPDGNIYIEIKKDILEIRCKGFKSRINGLNAEEFPVMPDTPEGKSVNIKQNILKDALQQVVNMASKSEARPEINGVFIDSEKGKIKFVSTDSFRLSEKSVESSIDLGSFILPQQSAYELIKILNINKNKDINIFITPSQVLFDNGDTQLFARLIDGTYPDYKKIIPENYKTKVIVNRNELINNVTIASLFSEKTNQVEIAISPGEGSHIAITSRSVEKGENKSKLNAEIEGEKLDTVLNADYLIDGLNNIYSDKIAIELNSGTSPIIFRPIGDENYLYLLMPLNK